MAEGRELRRVCVLRQIDRHWRDPSLPRADERRMQSRGAVGSVHDGGAGDADTSVRRVQRRGWGDGGHGSKQRNRRKG